MSENLHNTYVKNEKADQTKYSGSPFSTFVVHCLCIIHQFSVSCILSLYLASVDEQDGL